mmetsp:Transcript_44323/g.120779  ORF Transcript_44323/g.120779 Transcript_44323/m.120779 type:complete len:128 (+) Transcript_44323:286-669(+)
MRHGLMRRTRTGRALQRWTLARSSHRVYKYGVEINAPWSATEALETNIRNCRNAMLSGGAEHQPGENLRKQYKSAQKDRVMVIKHCAQCHKTSNECKIRACSRCQASYYCSSECSKLHWVSDINTTI